MVRVFQLAKELSVTSQAIIDRCIAEGVPANKVKNHMASVPQELRERIRSWFGTDRKA